MPSRAKLELWANSLGIDASTYPNDSKLEQKCIYLSKNATASTGAAAAGTLTSTGVTPTAGDTVTVGTTTYTFRASPAVAYDVAIGANAAAALTNLKAAINQTGTPGTEYAAGTFAHPNVTGGTLTATTLVLNAKDFAIGNDVATTETAATLSFGAGTLTGGSPKVITRSATMAAAMSGGANV